MRLPSPCCCSSSLTLLFALLLMLAPAVANAQARADTEAAERAFDEALVLMDAGRSSEPSASSSQRLDAQRLGAIVSAGVGVAGVAGVAAGTAFALHSLARHNESDRRCDGSAYDRAA